MKTKIIDSTGKEKVSLDLPKNFEQKIRKDIVLKVFEAQKRKQSHGTKIGAGAGYSASGISRKKRHAWKCTYGKGISRVPRKIMSRDGASFNWVGATTAAARGGRAAHPPRVEENQFRKINKKELMIAINSCLSASGNKKMIKEQYGIEITSPIVADKKILEVKTKNFIEFLKKVFGDNLERILIHKKIRSGKGKYRGRKYKKNAGILVVLGKDETMKRKGVEITKVDDLSLEKLSLNGVPGRLIIYTEKALKEIEEKWKE
jgi:large subunit ribosomal protein L4e